MEISRKQRDAWAENPENQEWEAVIGPTYKNADGSADLNRLFAIANETGSWECVTGMLAATPGKSP